ncbi:MAG: hypothetical protein Q9M29_09865 [Mariprofundaceae bacterium]|nr:hypothetical protein [Mariprofundaceae bacterium]
MRLLFALAVLTGMLMPGVANTAAAGGDAAWPAYELPLVRNGDLLHAPYGRRFSIPGGRSVHVAHVTPGRAYRLGLRLRSKKARKLSVTLYDRWPDAEGAHAMPLSTGGGLRGRQGEQEYQWWFSVAKDSAGSLLYVSVSVEPGFSGRDGDWTYQLFIVDSPRSPMNSLGRGVAYHRGPSDLKLQESRPSVPLHIAASREVAPIRHVGSGWRPGQPARFPGLIKNGDFSDGLRYWHLRPEKARGVGVLDGRLRLWSRDFVGESGVEQRVDAPVPAGGALRLSMDVMIAKQTESARPGRAPLMISLCYEDVRGMPHCGDGAFRRYFTARRGDGAGMRDVVMLPLGVWARYAFDMGAIHPVPGRIISISISGAGAPEREAWVRKIVLQ